MDACSLRDEFCLRAACIFRLACAKAAAESLPACAAKAAACACRAEEIREVVGRMRRYRGNVVVQEQAAKMLRRYVEQHC